MRRRVGKLSVCAALVAVTAACGHATAGTAVPDGDESATYVSAKFSEKLQSLTNDFAEKEPRKSTLDWFARIDDKKADNTITAVQLGRPPARVSKNHSNRNSAEYLDSFHPAGSPIEYMQLGPLYASLAPTPWVSMPYTGGNYGPCMWEGYQGVCKMLSAVSDSVDKQKAAKQAKSQADGSVELTAEVTLDTFLENRVITFPNQLLQRITQKMKTEPIPTRIILDPRGKLKHIEMNGKIAGDGHEVEVHLKYQVLETPTENDLPPMPDPAQVTPLPDQAAVSDFYNRMGEIQGS